MKTLLLSLISLLPTLSCFGQITFEKTYNIGLSARSSFVVSQDDGYLMAMISMKSDSDYLTFFKTDLNGDSLWTKDYNIGSLHRNTFTGTADDEGSIYILPESELTDVMKFDKDANMIWGRKYSCLKRRLAVKDNFLWVTGDHYPGNYLFKIDAATGDSLWRSDHFNLDNYAPSVVTSVAVLENGDVIITASKKTFDGEMQPSNFYRLPANSDTLVQFTLPTEEIFVVSDTKNLGNELISIANDVRFSSDHNTSFLLRYTANGSLNHLTKEVFGYPAAILHECVITNENQVVASGEIYLGYNTGNVMLHCFSMDGDSLWTRQFGDVQTIPWDLTIAGDNGFVMTGSVEQMDLYKPYLLKTDLMGALTGVQEIRDQVSIEVYPNPASDLFTFNTPGFRTGTITIFDSKGQTCTELSIRGGQTQWDCNQFSHGLYYYRIVCREGIATGKLIVE